MADPELEALRAKRMQELQMQYGKGPGSNAEENQQLAAQREKEREEYRNTILSQLLSQAARARLSNIALAKPDKAKMIEDILISNCQRGLIREKLSEEQLINFLEQVNQQTSAKKTVVKYDRRKTAIDDSDDDDDDDDNYSKRKGDDDLNYDSDS